MQSRSKKRRSSFTAQGCDDCSHTFMTSMESYVRFDVIACMDKHEDSCFALHCSRSKPCRTPRRRDDQWKPKGHARAYKMQLHTWT
eukprot:3154862-Amphidinium_carterae.1